MFRDGSGLGGIVHDHQHRIVPRHGAQDLLKAHTVDGLARRAGGAGHGLDHDDVAGVVHTDHRRQEQPDEPVGKGGVPLPPRKGSAQRGGGGKALKAVVMVAALSQDRSSAP